MAPFRAILRHLHREPFVADDSLLVGDYLAVDFPPRVLVCCVNTAQAVALGFQLFAASGCPVAGSYPLLTATVL